MSFLLHFSILNMERGKYALHVFYCTFISTLYKVHDFTFYDTFSILHSRLAYSVWMIDRLLDRHSHNDTAVVYVTYDIACTLHKHLEVQHSVLLMLWFIYCISLVHFIDILIQNALYVRLVAEMRFFRRLSSVYPHFTHMATKLLARYIQTDTLLYW